VAILPPIPKGFVVFRSLECLSAGGYKITTKNQSTKARNAPKGVGWFTKEVLCERGRVAETLDARVHETCVSQISQACGALDQGGLRAAVVI